MKVHSATSHWGWTLPQRCTSPGHYELCLQLWPIKPPEVKHSLVFLGDPEDLLDQLDPVEHTTCYTLENNLSQVTFTLQRAKWPDSDHEHFYSQTLERLLLRELALWNTNACWMKSSKSKSHRSVISLAAENMDLAAFPQSLESE